ncbi:MAG TPA: LysR family transcriptional regulator [Kineosporiaceae bacterium]|nr:LysR family transcriptional regulator [Kineosporiaceae bacterium]
MTAESLPGGHHDSAPDHALGGVLGVLWEDVEVFRAVAAALSFTVAAERLHLGRPVVSRRVQRLERAVRTPLFARSTRRVELTDAGLRLLRATEEMTTIWRNALAEVTALPPRGAARPLRVALNSADVVRAVAALTDALPTLRWQTESYNGHETLCALAEGELDVAVGDTAPGEGLPSVAGASVELVAREPIWLAVAADDPLARRRGGVHLAELGSHGWVAHPRPALRQWLDDVCAKAGFRPDVRHVAADVAVIRRLVSTGTVVSLSAPTARSDAQVAVVPLLDAPRRMVFTAARPGELADLTGLPAAHDDLQRAVRSWYAVRARQSPGYWRHVLAHPQDFPGIG